jgi:hypothetical protein
MSDDPFAPAPKLNQVLGHRAYGPVFLAQFDGSMCPECGGEIEPDEPCRMGSDGITHDECAEADEARMSAAGWSEGPDGWEP